MRDNIRAVIGEGAKACLVNYVFGGLDTLYELNREFGDQIFILAHSAGLSVMDSPDTGIGNGVFLGILARLAGAHGVMTMCPNPQNAAAMYDFYSQCIREGCVLSDEPLFTMSDRQDYLAGYIGDTPYPFAVCVPVRPEKAPAGAVTLRRLQQCGRGVAAAGT